VKLERKASGTDRLYIEAAVEESHNESAQTVALYRKLAKKNPTTRRPASSLQMPSAMVSTTTATPNPHERKDRDLEAVLKDAPNDSAANHYWIHAMEPSNHPSAPFRAPRCWPVSRPPSGHMVHMPGHIYPGRRLRKRRSLVCRLNGSR